MRGFTMKVPTYVLGRNYTYNDLVPAEILKEYCDQHSIKEFIILDVMTCDHSHQERFGRVSERVIL